MRCRTIFLALGLLSIGLYFQASAIATDPKKGEELRPNIYTILELDQDNLHNIKAETVVEICTRALTDKSFSDADTLVRIYERRAEAYFQLEKYENSKQDFEQVLKHRPSNLQARWKRARILGLLGHPIECDRELRKLIQDAPSYAPAYLSLALNYLSKEDWDSAVKCASKAIDLDKNLSHAYYSRALAYWQQGQYSLCLEDLNRTIQLCPVSQHSPEMPYILRGQVLNETRQYRLAIESLSMARKLNPQSPKVIEHLWRAHWGLGDYQVAAYFSEELTQIDKEGLFALCARVTSLRVIDKTEEALKVANKAITLYPKMPSPYHVLGEIYVAIGDYAKAIDCFDKALAIDNDSHNTLAAKAELFACCPDTKHRDGKKAYEIASKLCEITGKKDSRYLIILATAHAELGEYTEAIGIAKKALDLVDPKSRRKERYEVIIRAFQKNEPWRLEQDKLSVLP